eukprot:13568797-Alexandrium_andersonii.AAC.1
MLAIRHECLREPAQKERVLGVLEACSARGYVGTVGEGAALPDWEPAPPPGAPNRSLWAPAERPAGLRLLAAH